MVHITSRNNMVQHVEQTCKDAILSNEAIEEIWADGLAQQVV